MEEVRVKNTSSCFIGKLSPSEDGEWKVNEGVGQNGVEVKYVRQWGVRHSPFFVDEMGEPASCRQGNVQGWRCVFGGYYLVNLWGAQACKCMDGPVCTYVFFSQVQPLPSRGIGMRQEGILYARGA